MKKVLSTILVIATLFCMITALTGCGSSADYDAPLAVSAAYKNGEDVVGKTLKLTADRDNEYGIIFQGAAPDFSYMVEIYAEGDGADKIKSGDTVTIRITRVEESLAEYDVYGTFVK